MRIWILGLFLCLNKLSYVSTKPQGLPPQRLSCTIPNVGLVGGDLKEAEGGGGIRAKNAEECKFQCDRRAQCRFWSHVDDWKINCYLKAEAGEERKIDGATTGWKGEGCAEITVLELPHSQGLLDNSGCRLPGMALLGGDLTPSQNGDGITVRSFVECRTACRNQEGCEAFTFVKEWDANCFLKNGRIEESEFEGAISGTLSACEDSDRKQLVRLPSTSQSNSNPNQRLPLPSSQTTQRRPPIAAQRPIQSTQRRPPSIPRRPPPIPRRPPPVASNINRFSPTQPPPPAPAAPSVQFTPSGGNTGPECTFDNTNFLGGGLPEEEGGQGVEVPDPDACSQKCQSTPTCTHWTYVAKWKVNCYLKSRLGEKTEFEGGISGTYGSSCDDSRLGGTGGVGESEGGSSTALEVPSVTGQSSQKFITSGNGCIFENTNFLGGGLSAEEGGQGVEATDHQTCAETCQRNPRCHYWTFVTQWKVNCYLKSRLGEKSEFEGGVSGTFGDRCKSANGNSLDGTAKVQRIGDECIFQETNFLGGGLPAGEGGQGIETNDYEGCSKECRQRPQCHYWTFVEKWKVNCYLKSKLGEKTEFEAISGTYGNRCDSEVTDNQPFPSPISSPSSSNFAQPQVQAKELVKDGAGCRYMGVNLLGGDLPPQEGGYGIETASADACRVECGNRQNCNFWVFIKAWKIGCYLKEKKGPESAFEGAISGSLFIGCEEEAKDELGETGEPRDNDHECAYADTNLLGADLPAKFGGLGVNSPSADDCRIKCVQQRYCKHWVYVADWKVNCYLKSDKATHQKKEGSVAGSIGIRCLSGAVSLGSVSDTAGSAPKSTANFQTTGQTHFNPPVVVAPTNNRKDHCAYPGMNYQGGDLSDSQGGNGLETSSPEDCAAQCDIRSECQFWTHVNGWKVNCYLKSSFTSFAAKEDATSGSIGVECQESAVSITPAKIAATPDASLPAGIPSTKVPKKPTTQTDNVCFFQNTNIIGGDLSEGEGGDGVQTDNPNDCAIACYRNDKCVYWVHVPGWQRNCFLKSHFLEEESTTGITSGSIGLACE
ncbi:uncharacterized protein LOC131877823 isoform X2 [Tigriopus californicus]|uniref:uncharacterized protein LOC131877823 isoform X2 n=1 Tax=Tigriopus californicus TaxID=6832 RepID=UPI0027DA5BA0|nr:uncharacterized protein LOC131877823 isoform X2 [Tigriopus californicus]